ncbi:T9SS type A sorting domain-containing protein [Rhodocytophaga rosea]|uniref:T9SS type A sorting domain-containing protein n=1 Tax=Rhodocytophaga rosea TaxID=2704465 RepID=A0A6C0GRY7_9BACT|nr:T9SS type A sorting domain-containing protein [Rhodocytophaga rosea]QHT70250.1 T9SS type A sorting domain-containing protein [Rhodocytophaga rosea]
MGQTIRGSGNDDLRTLHQLSTGEYILTGYSQSGISGDKSQASQGATDYWVIKISSTGGKIWDKRFGGSGDDWVEASVVNSDGSIVLAGRSASGVSGDKSQASQGGRDFWVIKINSTGSKVWDKRFGGTGNEDANAMVATSDGYLIGGLSTSGISGDKSQSSQGGSDFWIIKINLSGTKLWDKRFGGTLTEDLRSIIKTTDGGFLLGGKSDSGVSGDKSQGSQGGTDYWSVKINSSGTRQWDKRFGGSVAEELRTVIQTSDGGYLLAGRSDSGISGDRTQASQGGTDYWMVKVSSSGGAGLIASARTEAEQASEEMEISMGLKADPNPFTEKITISFTLPQTEQVRLKVYNSQGLEVSTLFEGEAEKDKAYEFEWNANDQNPGMYIIRLGSESKMESRKVILVR